MVFFVEKIFFLIFFTSKNNCSINKHSENLLISAIGRPKRTLTLLEELHHARGEFSYRDGAIIGPCVLCHKEKTLSWDDWKLHLLEHTEEKRYYCIDCNTQIFNKDEHTDCPADSIIDVFGTLDIGCALEGYICQLCNHLKINDYLLMDHFNREHDELCSFYDIHVTQVKLVPDVRPQEHIIEQSHRAFVLERERYRCGVGYCTFHSQTPVEYSEHVHKAHSVFKTFYCPHCNLLINRKNEQTVAIQDVIQHINSHGLSLFQCFNCEFIASLEVDIRTHIAQHLELPLKFWRNIRRFNDAPDTELNEIVLDCALCGERVQNISDALEHFNEAHQHYEIHFKAKKCMKKTTKDSIVTCSTDNNELHYREVLTCGLCDKYFIDKHQWLKHFYVAHKSEPLVVKRNFQWLESYQSVKDDGFDRNMLFYCVWCENVDGLKLMCSGSAEGIYDHWEKKHKRSDDKPFQFYMAELIKCYYCDVLSTFQGLNEHIAEEHPDKSFIAAKAFETSNQCALCDFALGDIDELKKRHRIKEAEELNESDEFDEREFIKECEKLELRDKIHFEIEHRLVLEANVFNPIALNDFTLRNMLQIDVHKKVKCEYCEEVFETKDQYRIHHSLKHKDLEKMSRAFVDMETIKLVGDCCRQQIDPNSFLDHLEFHVYSFKCNLCTFQTTDPFNYMKHKVKTHEETDDVAALYLNFLQLKYWRSELVFGNGLVINKFNTQGTEYDHTQYFERFAKRLVDEKMNEFNSDARHNTSG